jgi:hypothetical protein
MTFIDRQHPAKLLPGSYRFPIRVGQGEGRVPLPSPGLINDLTTLFGNLDHVLIEPTGVFVLDTKNCSGGIASDREGELVLNGKNTDKDYVRPLVRRMLNVRDKALVLVHAGRPERSGGRPESAALHLALQAASEVRPSKSSWHRSLLPPHDRIFCFSHIYV